MILAGYLELDEEALICDLAQVYGILDHETVAPRKLAVLAKGLPSGSRIWAAVERERRRAQPDDTPETFDDPEAFESARARIIQSMEEVS